MRVSVVGGSVIDAESEEIAVEVGQELARRGHRVVCGGLGGVMEAACRGALEAGGHTIGILPGSEPERANDYVETPIATGMGNARNVLVVLNGAGVIAIDGSTGTLSEIAHALDFGLPVAGLATHSVNGIEDVETAQAAVEYIESEAG